MKTALSQFKNNIQRSRQPEGVALVIQKVAPTEDVSDLYRSQFVFAVSALDLFVHEIVRIGIFEIVEGKRQETDAYKKNIQIPISTVSKLIQDASQLVSDLQTPIQDTSQSVNDLQAPLNSLLSDFSLIISNHVRILHSYKSFQYPDSIADALRLISAEKLWERTANELKDDAKNLKDRLKLIIERRNKIAHEADMSPDGSLWPINNQMTQETISFIELIGETIYKIIGENKIVSNSV